MLPPLFKYLTTTTTESLSQYLSCFLRCGLNSPVIFSLVFEGTPKDKTTLGKTWRTACTTALGWVTTRNVATSVDSITSTKKKTIKSLNFPIIFKHLCLTPKRSLSFPFNVCFISLLTLTGESGTKNGVPTCQHSPKGQPKIKSYGTNHNHKLLSNYSITQIDQKHNVSLPRTADVKYSTKNTKWNNYIRPISTNKNINLRTLILLGGDIETNPGPRCNTVCITLNCRGLGDNNKFRTLVSNLKLKLKGYERKIIMLQETMIQNDDYIKFIWQNTYVFTAGTGHGRGCITLLEGVDLESFEHIAEDRGHKMVLKTTNDDEITAFNIYAPNGYSQTKREFFEMVLEKVPPQGKILIGGDINITLNEMERINTTRCKQEEKMAEWLKIRVEENELIDAWPPQDHRMTRMANDKASRLDRWWFRDIKAGEIETFWGLTMSDHAAVKLEITHGEMPTSQVKQSNFKRIVVNKDAYNTKAKRKRLIKKLKECIPPKGGKWTAQKRLEYAKCVIRTDYEDKEKEKHKNRNIETRLLEDEFNLLSAQFEIEGNKAKRQMLANKISRIAGKRDKLLETKGKRNADILKTKWFHEGEKSNKYFLGLLNKRHNSTIVTKLVINGTIIEDKSEIASEIQTYYKKLYESNKEMGENEKQLFIRELDILNEEEVCSIEADMSSEELLTVLKGTNDTAPGDDGITYSIYKYSWPIMGSLIAENWKESIETETLTHSHKTSLLTLLPKEGKDQKSLNNWRPITLSNCDIKIITKAYTRRFEEVMSSHISHHQTAYLRNRTISDNLRLILNAVKVAKIENKPLIIVSLDAQKAFDSIIHNFIKESLEHMGLNKFAKIFALLYHEQTVNILQDRCVVGNYEIKNGVKQGDALSCMLFNIVMETLLRKLNKLGMRKLESNNLGFIWPNAVGYADDVTLLLTNIEDLQICIDVYEDFYRATGLLLNATKTEIMTINMAIEEVRFNYLGKTEKINTVKSMKINGIIFNEDETETYTINWNKANKNLTDQLIRWTKRNLTILGKILIVKTYGISQTLYLARVLPPNDFTIKAIEKTMDKYIWTNSMLGNKAPNRIRKRIMTNALSRGGFGQANLSNIIRLMNTRQIIINEWNQSLASILNNKMTQVGTMNPTASKHSDGVIKNYVEITRILWENIYKVGLQNNETFNQALLNTKLANILDGKYSKGVWRHVLKAGSRKLGDLTRPERYDIRSKLRPELCNLNLWLNAEMDGIKTYPTNAGTLITYPPTSQMIDTTQIEAEYELCPKSGLIMTVNEASTFYGRIKKIQSIWARNTMLRFIHGDLGCNEKMFRTKYVDSPRCTNCWEIDTFQHRYFECEITKKVWRAYEEITRMTIREPNDLLNLTIMNLTYCAFVVNRLRKENLHPENIPTEVKVYVDSRLKPEARWAVNS